RRACIRSAIETGVTGDSGRVRTPDARAEADRSRTGAEAMTALLLVVTMLAPIAESQPGPRLDTASIRGRVTDKTTGQPIARAVVRASPQDRSGRSIATLSDDDGRYLLGSLPAGKYMIRAEPPVFRSTHVGAFYESSTAPGDMLTLQPGDERTSIDIAL